MIVTVSSVVKITSNRPRLSGSDFSRGTSAMRDDSVTRTAVCKQRFVFQGIVTAGIGQFCQSIVCSVPGQLRVLRLLAFVGRPTGVEIKCKTFAAEAVPSRHLVSR